MSGHTYQIHKLNNDDDRVWMVDFLQERWGFVRVVSRGKMYHPDQLPGFIAYVGGNRVGLLTYHIEGDQCEIITLDSTVGGIGVGSGLIGAAYAAAYRAGCVRLWVITTNDNIPAIRFYQKRGFTIAAVHVNALEESRKLKPEIPPTGLDGIPLRDEFEFQMPIRA